MTLLVGLGHLRECSSYKGLERCRLLMQVLTTSGRQRVLVNMLIATMVVIAATRISGCRNPQSEHRTRQNGEELPETTNISAHLNKTLQAYG